MEDRSLSIGLMVPENNTTMEPELLAWLPEGSSCRRLGIPRGKAMLSPETLPEYLAEAVKLAKQFRDEEIDLVVYGCTAAGFMGGPARDGEVASELAAITRKRVVTTASAMNAALQEIGARRIALITPYLDAVNDQLKKFLDPEIAIEVLASFRAETVDELAAITPEQISKRAREIVKDQPGIDAIFIACSQLPTRAIIPELERDLGVPVWSSIRATAWQATRVAEVA
jgi:maleate cis-trans isomerase